LDFDQLFLATKRSVYSVFTTGIVLKAILLKDYLPVWLCVSIAKNMFMTAIYRSSKSKLLRATQFFNTEIANAPLKQKHLKRC